MKNKLYRKCDYCKKTGAAKEEVFWVQEPYEFEIEEVDRMCWMHLVCEQESAYDI